MASLYIYVTVLLCLLGTTKTVLVFGQHYKRLRPVPTDKMPIPTLEEDPDNQYNPSRSDIDDVALRELLELDFLPNYMSSTHPRDFDDGGMIKPLPGRVPSEIRKLFRKPFHSRKPRKLWKRVMKHRRAFQTWLYQKTACPVHYRWKDLGIRFWPRYIKEGYCDSSKSCSIPAGMKCKSSAQRKIVILRWYCQGILEHKYCSWIKIQYPVISECKCQC